MRLTSPLTSRRRVPRHPAELGPLHRYLFRIATQSVRRSEGASADERESWAVRESPVVCDLMSASTDSRQSARHLLPDKTPRPPHPATVAQRSVSQPGTSKAQQPPHPATVIQRSIPQRAIGATPLPPHPATVAQRRVAHPATGAAQRPPHPATVVQRMERKKKTKQDKDKERVAGKKKSKEKKAQKTLSNLDAYQDGKTPEQVKYAKQWALENSLKGHHSQTSNSGMNAGTAKGVEKFNADFQAASKQKNDESSEDEFQEKKSKERKEPSKLTEQQLEQLAIGVWNAAVEMNNSGRDAMKRYLDSRAEHDPLVDRAVAANVWEIYEGFAPTEPLP